MELFQKIMMGILMILLGPLGHLLARAIYLNGSLDKIYMSAVPIFWMPPFSIITYILALFGFIKPAKGASPLDWTLLVSFIGNLMIPLIFSVIGFDQYLLGAFSQAILMFLVLLVTMYVHERINCNKANGNKGEANVKRVILNASISNLLGIILKVVLSIVLKFTPIGWALNLIEMVFPPFIIFKESLLYSMGSTTAVLGTNMYMSSYLDAYCTSEQSIIAPIIITISSLCVNMGYLAYKTFSPK